MQRRSHYPIYLHKTRTVAKLSLFPHFLSLISYAGISDTSFWLFRGSRSSGQAEPEHRTTSLPPSEPLPAHSPGTEQPPALPQPQLQPLRAAREDENGSQDGLRVPGRAAAPTGPPGLGPPRLSPPSRRRAQP